MKSRNPKGAAPLARQSAPGPRALPARPGCAERRGQAGLPGTAPYLPPKRKTGPTLRRKLFCLVLLKSVTHRQADDLLQRDILAGGELLRLLEHRLRNMGLDRLHVGRLLRHLTGPL